MENITAINKFVELPRIDDGQNDRALWCGGYDDANTTYCSLPGWLARLPVGSLEIQTPQLPLARALVRSLIVEPSARRVLYWRQENHYDML